MGTNLGSRIASRKADIGLVFLLFLLPVLWFAPQILLGRTLLPADNLFAFQPWKSFAAQFGAGVPHNLLISDLILENHPWKSLIVEALRTGRLSDVLWNPRIFTGLPFLADGQHSALYPFSLVFYLLPLWRAFGVFTWLQLALAAIGAYLFARLLGQSRVAATVAAVAYTFSGFFIVSVNFTMIIAGAAWLPWILATIEMILRKQEQKGIVVYSPIPYVVAGALLLGVQVLVGHVEITYYVLMVSAFYAAWRLIGTWRRLRALTSSAGSESGKIGGSPQEPPAGRVRLSPAARPIVRLAGWLAAMVLLGLAVGAVQLIPSYELVRQSFRQGSASLQQIRDWAWPSRQILTFLLPDVFGNPTHHSYFDIWTRAWAPVTQNALGQPLDTIDWGVKNYVEGANYLGVLTLLLAAVAVLAALWRAARRSSRTGPGGPPRFTRYVVLFGVLALFSLLFAFGTPLYAVLYYLVPGYSQLHSAFRWVFPYTLSMALLAGFGLDMLLSGGLAPGTGKTRSRIGGALGWLVTAAGLAALGLVAVSLVVPGPFVALGDRLLAASDLARTRGFADGSMAWSYEAGGIARFGLMAVLGGALVAWGAARTRAPDKPAGTRTRSRWQWAALALILADLWLFGHNFNSAADPALLDFKPPVINWLEGRTDPTQPWRLTSFDGPDDKTLNANSAMPYGLEDVRGYDSIIPRQYVAYMERIQPQGDLLYNRIAPIYTQVDGQANYDALDSRLLDLLGVRYVMTTHAIPNAGYELAYDGEVKVYENRDALPRAFIVPQAVVARDQTAALDLLERTDPAQAVVVEVPPGEGMPAGTEANPPADPTGTREARISRRTNREIFVDVNLSQPGWLVLTDNYFDGWKAYLRPFGVEGEGVNAQGQSIEQQLPLYRADGTFRAVYVPRSGQWTVRYVYSPRSLLLGLYTSFLAVVTLMLLSGWWAWGRYYRGEGSEVGTVAKNSVIQIIMSLMSRGIDFAFAMLRLRVLSPTGEGSYAFAIAFYGIFEILTRFGLGTLLTRDVALDRNRANRYLVNVIALRTRLWLLSLPVMAAVMLFYRLVLHQLTLAEAQAIVIFIGALFFANIADAISAVLIAFEKMEYPAGVATAVAAAKVALGALVILPPFDMGFVGLAGVSLVMNLVQAVWLYLLMREKVLPHEQRGAARAEAGRDATAQPGTTAPGRLAGRTGMGTRAFDLLRPLARPWRGMTARSAPTLDSDLQRHMLRESGPLMINHLLASVFWRADLWILMAFAGAASVGIFSAAVKYLDGLNVIPSYFTIAIFPLMSRYAQPGGPGGDPAAGSGRARLERTYRLAAQLLFVISLPVAILVTFEATPLIRILGGAAYLPDSATALAIMIWSIPIGFVNSVTQYVLISVNQQRFLTKAFLIGVGFNTVANLIFVPRYGYLASAVILIPAELSLFIPFYWAVRRHVAPMPWLGLLGRPVLAAMLNVALVLALQRAGIPLLLALVAGAGAYGLALLALGIFRDESLGTLRGLLRRRSGP
jgi:O-antigen/teichoic acid export membrane protein